MTAEASLAFSYIRMSTDLQIRGDSLRRQLQLSEQYASDHGLRLAEGRLLRDIGVSAFNGAHLAGGAFGTFMQAVRAGSVPAGSYLLVESLDRISRQALAGAASLFLELVSAGIIVVTLSDRRVYRSNLDIGDLVYSLMIMSRAHEESRIKSQRLKEVWRQKRACAGTSAVTAICPAWLQRDGGAFVLIAERANIVRGIFEESAAGFGSYAITRRLNERSVKPFGRSLSWQQSYVTKILANRATLGEYQPHRMEQGKRVADGDPVSSYFPAVIEEALFRKAAHARNIRRVGGAGRKGSGLSNLFSGIAQCAYCGAAMHFVNKGTGPRGGTRLYCDGARRGLACSPVGWRYRDFEASFLTFVKELDLSSVLNPPDDDEPNHSLIAGIEAQLSDLRRKRDRTYELALAGGEDDAFLASKLKSLSVEIDQEERRLSTAREAESIRAGSQVAEEERRASLHQLIDEVQGGSTDLLKVRTTVAGHIKGIASAIVLAPAGRAPSLQRSLRFIEGINGASAQTELRENLQAELAAERMSWPYFGVVFRSGASRVVVVDPSDPLAYREQVEGDPEGFYPI
jgi:DNA invertase Pin-like site-specific DNA recombinase